MTESFSWLEANERLEIYRQSRVSKSTKLRYLSCNRKFFSWLLMHKTDLIRDDVKRRFENQDQRAQKVLINDILKNGSQFLKCDDLTVETFVSFASSLRKANKDPLSHSSYASYRSALGEIFRHHRFEPDDSFQKLLKDYFAGMTRVNSDFNALSSNVAHKQGKDPMAFDFHQWIANYTLTKGEKELYFCHAFLILGWNLMARSKNTKNIRFPHVSWKEDALIISFAQQKNDQIGKKKDPRHIHANPLNPAVCPVLALGSYWLTFDFENRTDDLLFPGDKQSNRFGKALSKIFNDKEHENVLRLLGVKNMDFGTHSIRKGSATYVSSGSTACPSGAAICLRAGWSLPGVQDAYIRCEAAGDQFVGRASSGLPVLNENFAVLPPRFADIDESLMQSLTKVLRGMPDQLLNVGIYALASLVYHSEFLIRFVPSHCVFFSNVLFTEQGLLNDLKMKLRGDSQEDSTDLMPTGIPPHVALLDGYRILRERQDEIINVVNHDLPQVIERSKNDTIDKMIQEIEERALKNNTISNHGLSQAINRQLNQNDVLKKLVKC